MTEVKKFNMNDDFDDFDNDATQKDVDKSSFRGMIKVGTFHLEVVKAQLDRSKVSDKDPAFFAFNITVQNTAGDTRDIYSKFSFKKFKYGEKGTMIFAIKLREFFRAFGFPELSLKDIDKAQDREILKSYMVFDENGCLPFWEGLKFEGTFAYPKDSFHMEKDTHETKPWFLADSNGNPHVFPSAKVFDDIKNETVDVKNVVLRAATTDSLKSEAGISGIINDIKMSELKFLKAIPGVNDAKLAKLVVEKTATPAPKKSVVDPQTLVKGEKDEDFPG